MNRPSIVRELFLPMDQAWWDGERFTLGAYSGGVRPGQRGVRLQEPGPESAGASTEKDTQRDFCALFDSVAELRRVPELGELVLSEETRVGEQSGAVPGKRAMFGLQCGQGGRFQAEGQAAAECYRVARRTIERAGYRIEHPRDPYDPSTGFTGLHRWAEELRLRRKRDWRPWLLLLLLLPLPFLFRSCKSAPPAPPPPAPDTLFNVPVETDSFIILLDKSGSMGPYFAQVRDEARRLLEERSRDKSKQHFADLIVYDAETDSVLDELKPVTPENITRITTYLNDMKAGGWTNLAVAVDLASKEVVRHNKKTTLIVITDGEDKTVRKMIRDKRAVKAKFGDVPVTVNAISPRLFTPGADPRPANFDEEDLAEFCKIFNGRFGPVGTMP